MKFIRMNAYILLCVSLTPIPIVAQQQSPALSPEAAATQHAALLLYTRKYSGKEADAIRTPAEKLAGKLDMIARALPGDMTETDLSLIKAYAAVDAQHLLDYRNGMVGRQRELCNRADSLSDLDLVKQMDAATNEARLDNEEYYEGLLRSLSNGGREALMAAADKMFGGGTLVRVDGTAFAAAAPTAAAYNIRTWCTKPVPPPPAPSQFPVPSDPAASPVITIQR